MSSKSFAAKCTSRGKKRKGKGTTRPLPKQLGQPHEQHGGHISAKRPVDDKIIVTLYFLHFSKKVT